MNHDCHGDTFHVDGEMYYRCLLDSTIMRMPVIESECPRCRRKIVHTRHGEVSAETYTTRIVRLKIHGEGYPPVSFELPSDRQSERE